MAAEGERPGSEVIQGSLLSGVWYLKTGGIWILFLWRRGGGGGAWGTSHVSIWLGMGLTSRQWIRPILVEGQK